jgi:hypothetical protein
MLRTGMDGCTIGHHDELSGDRSVGDEVTLLTETMSGGSGVCDTNICGIAGMVEFTL